MANYSLREFSGQLETLSVRHATVKVLNFLVGGGESDLSKVLIRVDFREADFAFEESFAGIAAVAKVASTNASRETSKSVDHKSRDHQHPAIISATSTTSTCTT